MPDPALRAPLLLAYYCGLDLRKQLIIKRDELRLLDVYVEQIEIYRRREAGHV
jgi:hypothetical protein